MNRGKVISLNRLTRTHGDQIDKMAQGIRGDADGVLWTSKMRSSVRGGKPCGGNRTDSIESES
jgi:hypothetical protein